MFHIFNSDDVVPRMGAIWHLGRVLVYPACADMRRACYEWPMDTKSISDRRLVRGITSQMTDTGHDMIVGMAYRMTRSGQVFVRWDMRCPIFPTH